MRTAERPTSCRLGVLDAEGSSEATGGGKKEERERRGFLGRFRVSFSHEACTAGTWLLC